MGRKRNCGNMDTGRRENLVNEMLNKQPFTKRILKQLITLLFAVFFGVMNSYHQYTMFENSRHFSHLSALEREMTFRTEMGLYYSYFKVIVEAPSFLSGINEIMNDNRTEYPSIINTLQRFNLYPEVLLGASYRIFQSTAEYLNVKTKDCWEVIRGDDLPPIQSCEGLGEHACFYITGVFVTNGLVSSLIFIYGKLLSNSFFGGILAVFCFFFNHGECTRVQWTPPLRESFGYPMSLLQMFIVTEIVGKAKTKLLHSLVLAFVIATFILFWQFSQFALLTQIFAIFGTYVMNFMPAPVLHCILAGHGIGLLLAVALLFGNKMLLTSFYCSAVITVCILTCFEKYWNMKRTFITQICNVLFFFVGSIGLKTMMSIALQVTDDAHIWNILRSKFTSYRDFHTMLYTCAEEFDFLQQETYVQLAKTLLLPTVIVLLFAISIQLFQKWKEGNSNKMFEEGIIFYNTLQLLAYLIMAVLIMRLKLFFIPHLCIMVSLIASQKCLFLFRRAVVQYSAVAVLLGLMSIQGVSNIEYQRNIVGEYSNPSLEELIMWVNSSTSPDHVFAGPMPTMANLMLSTRRAIVNHPHYEDAGLRERTHKVYQVYSRKSPTVAYKTLHDMGVNYVIIEKNWCFGQSKKGCYMAEIWDIEDHENHGQKPLCQRLVADPAPFRDVFHNSIFTVLAL